MECDFSPSIWPEDRAPIEVIDCQKCELCKQGFLIIWGEEVDV